MTIDSGYIPEGFSPTPSLTYTFKFEHIGPESIRVNVVYEAGPVAVPTSDYTLTLTEPTSDSVYVGGVVEFNRPHPSNVISISIVRETPTTQLVDYQPYGPFPAETHEYALDKITLVLQEHNFGIALALASGGDGGGSPVQGIYVPLSGTAGGFPITGGLDFSTDGGNKEWTIVQNSNLFDVNALLLTSTGPNSSLFINTTDAEGSTNTFSFTASGELYLPSPLGENNEVWVMKGVDFLGTENMLSVYSFDQDTNLRTSNPITLYTSETQFANITETGKIVMSGQTEAADGDTTLTTKKYVDDAITDAGGLPPGTLGQLLIHDGSGWTTSQKFLVDESSFGEAWVSVDGRLIIENPDTIDAVGTLRQLDFLGRNTTAFEFVGGQGGLIVAETTVGAGDEITLADGFISIPKTPVDPNHAATKQYVDDQSSLPDAGVNAVLRNDGSGWVAATGVALDSGGGLTVATLAAQRLAATNLTPTGQLLEAGEFGIVSPSGLTRDSFLRTDAANQVKSGAITAGQLGATNLGTGNVNSAFGGLTNSAVSDARFKDVRETEPYGLNELGSITPVRFTWNIEGMGADEMSGFTAQDIQMVMPELVVEASHEKMGDYLSFDQTRLIPVLVKAIQELTARVAELEEK